MMDYVYIFLNSLPVVFIIVLLAMVAMMNKDEEKK